MRGSEVSVRMTYELIEGVCNKSLALNVAKAAGLPPSIIERAAALIEKAKADKKVAANSTRVPAARNASSGGAKPLRDEALIDGESADNAQLRAARAVLAQVTE